MDAFVEGDGAPQCRLDAQRAGHERRGEDVLEGEQAFQRERERDLGAVDHREPFLGRRHERLQPQASQRDAGGNRLAVQAHLAFAHHRGAEVGERGEIARRADRPLGRNARMRIAVEQLDQRIDHGLAHPRVGEAQRVDLEQHGPAHHPVREQCPGAGGVGEDQPALQLAQQISVDGRVGEAAHARVDAVHAPAFRDGPVDHRLRGSNRFARICIKGDAGPGLRQPACLRERQPSRPKYECLITHVSNHSVPSPLGRTSTVTVASARPDAGVIGRGSVAHRDSGYRTGRIGPAAHAFNAPTRCRATTCEGRMRGVASYCEPA